MVLMVMVMVMVVIWRLHVEIDILVCSIAVNYFSQRPNMGISG